MRLLLFPALLAAAACGPPRSVPIDRKPPLATATITLGARAPRSGDIRVRRIVLRSTMRRPSGQVTKREDSQVVREQLEGERLRVTWVDRRVVTVQDGGELVEPPSILVGRTFLIEIRDGKTIVFDADGNPCDDDACRMAARDYAATKSAAQGSSKGLHRPIAVGEPVDDLAPLLFGGLPAGWAHRSPRATLDHLEGSTVAVFRVSTTLIDGAHSLTLKLDSEARYEIATGRALSFKGSGTLTAASTTADGKQEIVSGPIAYEETTTYR